MTNQHPITPPPELVQQLCDSAALSRSFKNISIREVDVLLILEAFQAGADQELEACVEWLVANQWFLPEGKGLTTFRAVRRPKPPSLKEQAIKDLDDLEVNLKDFGMGFVPITNLRKALEALPND
jgi:hypothetical protein